MQTLSKFLIEDSHDIITHSVVYTCLLIYCVLLILLSHLCVTYMYGRSGNFHVKIIGVKNFQGVLFLSVDPYTKIF